MTKPKGTRAPAIELPPTIIDRVRERRNRTRMELNDAQAEWLAALIGKTIESIDIDDPQFNVIYPIYESLTRQMRANKEEDKGK